MGQSVLIAGKDVETINGLEKGFHNMGFDVEQANDGDEVLKLLSGHSSPTAIILSSALDGMKTLPLCKEIRAMRKFQTIPILIMEDTPVNREAYAAVGVREIFEKPIYCSKIQQRLDEMLAGRKDSKRKKPNQKKQLMGVLILLGLFALFVVGWIVLPSLF